MTPEDLDAALRKYPPSRELQPAVVLDAPGRSIAARIRGQDIGIDWEFIEWARAYRSPNHIGPELTAAAEVVQRGDVVYVSPARSRDGGDKWRLDQLPQVGGALVSLDPNSGAVRALAGGFDYYLSKFNRAAQALRQPGSNLKPFIYSAALEHGFTAAFEAASAKPMLGVAIRDAINEGIIPGPRMTAGSPEITVTGGLGDERRRHIYQESFSLVGDGPVELRKSPASASATAWTPSKSTSPATSSSATRAPRPRRWARTSCMNW